MTEKLSAMKTLCLHWHLLLGTFRRSDSQDIKKFFLNEKKQRFPFFDKKRFYQISIRKKKLPEISKPLVSWFQKQVVCKNFGFFHCNYLKKKEKFYSHRQEAQTLKIGGKILCHFAIVLGKRIVPYWPHGFWDNIFFQMDEKILIYKIENNDKFVGSCIVSKNKKIN